MSGGLATARRWMTLACFLLTTALLLLVIVLLMIQPGWDRTPRLEPREAFYRGSIGTEIMPLPVFVALPKLFPEYFQPLGENCGPYWRQFGMNRRLENDYGLPTGFFISHKRPKSGSPSPVRFVGISCVMCHSTEIHKPNGESRFVVGAGNMTLNLFAWIDCFQTAILDERLKVDDVCRVFEQETGETVSPVQRGMIALWLRDIRGKVREAAASYGDPYHGRDVLDPDFMPTGPCRTQPFRTLVRRLLDRPGSDMAVYTKVATVFHEDRREWAQVDGSIRDLHSRSSVAAFAAGATVQNMADPIIAHNIRQASDFTRDLSAPSFYDIFPEEAARRDEARIAEGREVYRRHCHVCHGSPTDDGGWKEGERQGDVVSYQELGTDPERVTFRRFEELPERIFESFPEQHPFHFKREEIRPGPAGKVQGYVNAPIERVYARAPYLHNASVLTLAELIHLEPRRDVFYRGRNTFDPEKVGLSSPEQPTREVYFRFDTRRRGNSNRGHDYPWAYDDPERDEEALRALLEYLRSF